LLSWGGPGPIELHEPSKAFLLSCGRAGCDYAHDVTATITIDSTDDEGWRGSYEVTQKDGTKQAGSFVAKPKKRQKNVVCF
jgi:hypothetical protein